MEGELKLTKYQDEMLRKIIFTLIEMEETNKLLEEYFTSQQIMNYMKEGIVFLGDDENVSVTITSDIDQYSDLYKVTKDGMIATINSYLIKSFKFQEDNYLKLRKGKCMVSEIVGQEFSITSDVINNLNELVFVRKRRITKNLHKISKDELNIIFYVRERKDINIKIL